MIALGWLLRSPATMNYLFEKGVVLFPLDMRIPRTHIHISRGRCGRIFELRNM
jgi:hypothetical protein